MCAAVISVSAMAVSVSAGWVKTDVGVKYTDSDGNYVKSKWLKTKDGKKYYIKSNGYRATGLTTLSSTNSDGKKVKSYYYFDKNGVMQTGWKLIKGNYYYFQKSGKAVAGKKVKIGDTYSYKFDSKGVWDEKVYKGSTDVTSKVNVDKLTGIKTGKNGFSAEFTDLMKRYEEATDDYFELMDKASNIDESADTSEYYDLIAEAFIVLGNIYELDEELAEMEPNLTQAEIKYYNDFYKSFESKLNSYTT